jgi:hypothetical protein
MRKCRNVFHVEIMVPWDTNSVKLPDHLLDKILISWRTHIPFFTIAMLTFSPTMWAFCTSLPEFVISWNAYYSEHWWGKMVSHSVCFLLWLSSEGILKKLKKLNRQSPEWCKDNLMGYSLKDWGDEKEDRNQDSEVYAHEGWDGIKHSWKLDSRLPMFHVSKTFNTSFPWPEIMVVMNFSWWLRYLVLES